MQVWPMLPLPRLAQSSAVVPALLYQRRTEPAVPLAGQSVTRRNSRYYNWWQNMQKLKCYQKTAL